jgi:hypothetical protein
MKHISKISKVAPVTALIDTSNKPCDAIKDALNKDCTSS